MEAFESALKLSSEPFVFNNVAYYLSLSGKGLDKAQQYAESAVSETASRLRSAQLNLLNMDTIAKVGALASYWDTLGWVYFQKGDLESAEKYVTAAWNVANHSEVGDHLGQIKEKQGKKDEAAKWYATAAASLHPVHQAGEHLAALVPKDQQTKMLINAKEELETQRHFFIQSPLKNEKESKESKESGEAYFFLMLNPDESQRARVTDIKFIKGSEKLRAHGSLLKDLAIHLTFPDKTTTKIIRKGLLWCEPKSDKCKFTLIYHDDVISIN